MESKSWHILTYFEGSQGAIPNTLNDENVEGGKPSLTVWCLKDWGKREGFSSSKGGEIFCWKEGRAGRAEGDCRSWRGHHLQRKLKKIIYLYIYLFIYSLFIYRYLFFSNFCCRPLLQETGAGWQLLPTSVPLRTLVALRCQYLIRLCPTWNNMKQPKINHSFMQMVTDD